LLYHEGHSNLHEAKHDLSNDARAVKVQVFEASVAVLMTLLFMLRMSSKRHCDKMFIVELDCVC
jgi:hypothetical protein